MFFFGEVYKVQNVLQNLHPFFIYLFRDKKFQYFSFSVFTKTKKIYFIKNFVTLVNFVPTRPIFKKTQTWSRKLLCKLRKNGKTYYAKNLLEQNTIPTNFMYQNLSYYEIPCQLQQSQKLSTKNTFKAWPEVNLKWWYLSSRCSWSLKNTFKA